MGVIALPSAFAYLPHLDSKLLGASHWLRKTLITGNLWSHCNTNTLQISQLVQRAARPWLIFALPEVRLNQ